MESSGETLGTPGAGVGLTPGQAQAGRCSHHLARSTHPPSLGLACWAPVTLTLSHHLSPAGVWPAKEGDSVAGRQRHLPRHTGIPGIRAREQPL